MNAATIIASDYVKLASIVATRLRGVVRRTPLLESPVLNERVGGRLLLKAECLQHTGSFKYRGAYYALSCLNQADQQRGVVGISSGNHAQGLACAAQALGIRATVIMPVTAPDVKVRQTRAFGAEVILFDGPRDNWDDVARATAESLGAAYIHSYDEPNVILGQSTAGLEIVEQAKEGGAELDLLLVPCGGGGLTAGCALAIESFSPHTETISVEPTTLNDVQRSLASGRREENPVEADSICDALRARRPGGLVFSIVSRVLRRGVSVEDAAVVRAMAFAARHLKLVLEPGGAVALASALAGAIDLRGKCAAAVLSGGNVNPSLFANALTSAAE